MILVDYQIRNLCIDSTTLKAVENPMLYPFAEPTEGEGRISYGLTSAGYDLRLHPKALIFKNSFCEVVNPKRFMDADYRKRCFDEIEADMKGVIKMPAGPSYILAMSLEYIKLPKYLKGRCVGKSTYARCGIIVNTTPLEPEWEGHLTIEIANTSPMPVELYAFEGIAQLEFEELASVPDNTYASKKGKYQSQMDVTPARVK